MSKPFSSTFNVHTFSAAPYTAQNASYASGSQNTQFSWSLSSTSSAAQPIAPTTFSTSNGVSLVQSSPVVSVPVKKPVKVKKRTEEEIEVTKKAAERFSARLAQDQAAVLQPDVDTPFVDQADVVRRLLPYHIYYQPYDDLELLKGSKGKQKATDADLKAEIEETRFALECHKRYNKLRQRFRAARIRTASRASPDDQAYILAQAVLEADRVDASLLSNELKVARSDLERLEREKRAATAIAARTQYTPTPASTTPAQSPVVPTIQAQYYRAYPYAYTQAYGSAVTPPTTTTFQVNPPATLPPSATTNSRANTAIPVQLPVASLPALHALGIHPVPATSVAEGQPPPPAVLRGSTANGTMLMLEINVSLLQSAQMSGLAMVLNSLMSRTSTSATGASPAASNTSTRTQPTPSGTTGGTQQSPVPPSTNTPRTS
ncbi:hypothetical protein NP233_g1328 [Leucocoprinus birnbaumii]|uniref:GLTSCR protein conserved domain-containing protein n=1 Tax=Leucocoprinus birnbaumii TaxID=56174 RepID=A0AAD5W0I1_9AGAR|nr:hypothetical protein NP233_g1328 [Leucocoprinus birnbaumii]